MTSAPRGSRSAAPRDPGGTPVANRVGPGVRPRSSMAPTLVFDTAADGTRAGFPVTNVGGEHPDTSAALVAGLRALGHTVNTATQTSGIATIVRDPATGELLGGADPRRDGLVLGDLVAP